MSGPFCPGLVRAREAADDLAAIAPVRRGNEFNRFAVGEIGRASEMKNGGFFADAQELGFFGGGDGGVSDVGRGSDAFEGKDTGARLGTADAHFFAEGKNLAKILFELGARDESAFSALAVCDAEMTEGFEGLASRHAADAHA